MSTEDIRILNRLFSDEFDVLYNNITSNQAPGLDEYEKSIFLTKAQDEIIKDYFNPVLNKTREGFDGSERRLIDFSMLIKSFREETVVDSITVEVNNSPAIQIGNTFETFEAIKAVEQQQHGLTSLQIKRIAEHFTVERHPDYNEETGENNFYIVKDIQSPFLEAVFDDKPNTKAVTLPDDMLMIVNEYAIVIRNGSETRLTVASINYADYARLTRKPFQRPIKNVAWRLMETSFGKRNAEIIIGPNDTLWKYAMRYVKRPRAIRLATFDKSVTIEGSHEEQCCELDPILFPEIIQRAVELAKAAYSGDLTSQIALAQASQIPIGAVAQLQ